MFLEMAMGPQVPVMSQELYGRTGGRAPSYKAVEGDQREATE